MYLACNFIYQQSKLNKMKKMFTLLLPLLFMASVMQAQIDTFKGIFDIDSCDFSIDCSNLLVIDTTASNLWIIGLPQKPFFDTASSPPNAILTDTINVYPQGNHSTFVMDIPDESFFNTRNFLLTFKHKYQSDTLLDGGYIEISYDGGLNWVNILNDEHPIVAFNAENLYTDQDSLFNNELGFSGTSDGWVTTKIQWVWALPVAKLQGEDPKLRFNFVSDSLGQGLAGWMIDDILFSYADLGSSTRNLSRRVQAKVFPNPMANGAEVRIEGEITEAYTLHLFDLLGRELQTLPQRGSDIFWIDRAALRPGMYLIQSRTKTGQQFVGKVLVE